MKDSPNLKFDDQQLVHVDIKQFVTLGEFRLLMFVNFNRTLNKKQTKANKAQHSICILFSLTVVPDASDFFYLHIDIFGSILETKRDQKMILLKTRSDGFLLQI